MKKFSEFTVRWIVGMAAFLVLAGCDSGLFEKPLLSKTEENRASTVSQRVGELKKAGLLNSLLSSQGDRSIRETDSNYFEEEVLYFINNTDEALAEIALSDDGQLQLELIELMFTGGTVGEIADVMAQISHDMADEYLTAIEELATASNGLFNDNEQGRAVAISGNIRNMRVGFYDETNRVLPSRGAYAANFNTDTVAWYIGFCAATTAGCIAASAKLPWVVIPGIVVAVAGGASMAAQLLIWSNCADLFGWVSSLANKDGAPLTAALNSSIGPQILTIFTATSVTALIISITPAGKAAWALIKSYWNIIVGIIRGPLPSWIIPVINGIKIVLI